MVVCSCIFGHDIRSAYSVDLQVLNRVGSRLGRCEISDRQKNIAEKRKAFVENLSLGIVCARSFWPWGGCSFSQEKDFCWLTRERGRCGGASKREEQSSIGALPFRSACVFLSSHVGFHGVASVLERKNDVFVDSLKNNNHPSVLGQIKPSVFSFVQENTLQSVSFGVARQLLYTERDQLQ